MKEINGNEIDVVEAEVENVSLCQDVTPWPKPVNGAQLLERLVQTIRRHVVVSMEAAVATAAWVLFTHVNEAFRILPLLVMTSPTRGCGKSTMLTLLTWTVRRPLAASNMTPAVLFRAVDQEAPTVLLDEGDTFITKNRELQNLINSGHARDTVHVYRVEKGKVRRFNTASPKAVAAIGSLPDTIEHRAVAIEMRRKSASDKVDDLTRDAEVEIRKLGQMAARWANDNMARILTITPTMPSNLLNRSSDNWRPLLTVGECAGGKWPKEMRQAAVTLTKFTDTSDDAIGELLLRDLKPIVEKSKNEKAIPSAMIVERLVEMEHRPWAEGLHGRSLTAPRMAHILKPFGIQPGLYRVGSSVVRGYKPGHFEDAIQRYAN